MFVRNNVYNFCKAYFILANSLSNDIVSMIKFSLDYFLTRYLRFKEVFCMLIQKNLGMFFEIGFLCLKLCTFYYFVVEKLVKG